MVRGVTVIIYEDYEVNLGTNQICESDKMSTVEGLHWSSYGISHPEQLYYLVSALSS